MSRKDNKIIEDMLKNIEPVLPSEGFKKRVIDEQNKIPLPEVKPVNNFMVFVKRYAVYLGCLIAIIAFSATFLGLYAENYYEVYIDINPSIEVSFNRFGVVNRIRYINEDAETCLEKVNVIGKSPEAAVELIAEALSENGYFENGAELYISGYSNKMPEVDGKVDALYYRLADLTEENGYSVDVFTKEFTSLDRENAVKEQMSPLKYRLVSEIITLDDSYTKKELKTYKISELMRIYNFINNCLTFDDFAAAEELSVSPMKYQLVEELCLISDTADRDELLSMPTSELKVLYQNAVREYHAGIEAVIKEEAEFYGIEVSKYRVIYWIIKNDPSYTVESLKDRSIIELKALEYALEKYDFIKDFIKR